MNAPEAPVREGEILAGKYRVERILGVGGMGVVVAAMHTELDERVALKFLLPTAAQNPGVVARFSREARAAAKIKSEHVARVRDVGTMESGIPYIVMEYLEGCDLADVLLKRGQLPVGEAVDYILQAGEAIAEAHAVGFIHRDLKPANLFLARQADGTNMVKVLDFGISKATINEGEPSSVKEGALTRTTDIFGSPMYMSPEQLKSARDVDARADIWALGVILYELITGKAPFDRPTVAETFGAILYETPAPVRAAVASVPEPLERAILRCIEKDKSKRFANVADLAKALFPFAESMTRQSVDRVSRVLKRAGVVVDSVPPPPTSGAPDSVVGAAVRSAATVASEKSQTRTNWGSVERTSRQGGRAAMIGGFALAILLAAGGLYALQYLRRTTPAARPDTTATPAPTTAAAAPPMKTAAPAPTVTASAQASSEPSAVPSAEPLAVPAQPGARPGGGHGKARSPSGAGTVLLADDLPWPAPTTPVPVGGTPTPPVPVGGTSAPPAPASAPTPTPPPVVAPAEPKSAAPAPTSPASAKKDEDFGPRK